MQTIAEWQTGEFLWDMLWFTLFFIWIWILITCFMDIFRDHELSGWGKALWLIFIIVLPYLGVFVYLIARGAGMQERGLAEAQKRAEMQRQYIQTVAAGSSGGAADEIARLVQLRDSGAITEEEFQALKAKAMA